MVGQKLTDGWKYGAGPLQDAPIPHYVTAVSSQRNVKFSFFSYFMCYFFVFLRLIYIEGGKNWLYETSRRLIGKR